MLLVHSKCPVGWPTRHYLPLSVQVDVESTQLSHAAALALSLSHVHTSQEDQTSSWVHVLTLALHPSLHQDFMVILPCLLCSISSPYPDTKFPRAFLLCLLFCQLPTAWPLFPWEQCVCVTDNNVLSSQAHWRSAPWDCTQRVLCATCELLACRIGAADPGSCPWVLIIQQSVGLWWGELLSPRSP